MPKESLQEKGVRVMLEKGFTEIVSKTQKYRIFTHPKRPDTLYFIGKKGAVRAGKNVSSSYSIGKIGRAPFKEKEV